MTPAEWHAIRARHVGGSEIAALFGLSPHTSKFALWHQKAGHLTPPDLSGDEVVQAGVELEAGIARLIARKTGWRLRKVRRYCQHRTVEGMGATLDYEIFWPQPAAPGVLQIKNVSWLERQKWGDEPPIGYQLQLQHELACARRQWGALGVLVGGNATEVWTYAAHAGTQAKIKAAVIDFWASIRAGIEPPIVPEEGDGEILSLLNGRARQGSLLDLRLAESSPDQRVQDRGAALEALCHNYLDARRVQALNETEAKLTKGLILRNITDTSKVLLAGYTINAGQRSDGARNFLVSKKGSVT